MNGAAIAGIDMRTGFKIIVDTLEIAKKSKVNIISIAALK